MKSGIESLFKDEYRHLKAAHAVLLDRKTEPAGLIDSFGKLAAMYEKNLNEMIKITEISDSQHRHLMEIQSKLKKEVEERKKAEASLSRSNKIIQTVLDNIEALIFVVAGSGKKLLFANRCARITFDAKDGTSLKIGECREFLPPKGILGGNSEWPSTSEVKCGKNKRWYGLTSSRITWIDGREVFLQVGIDITERKLVEKQLEYYAYTDPLTGISNRRTGLIILERALNLASRQKHPISVCYIDLDGLKAVNDGFGHDEGDYMIVSVSRTIKDILRNTDVISRLGGDEFLLVFPDCTALQAEKVIRRIRKKIREQEKRVVKPYALSFSYGIIEFKGNTMPGVEEVIKFADEKMYRDKIRKKKHALESKAN